MRGAGELPVGGARGGLDAPHGGQGDDDAVDLEEARRIELSGVESERVGRLVQNLSSSYYCALVIPYEEGFSGPSLKIRVRLLVDFVAYGPSAQKCT